MSRVRRIGLRREPPGGWPLDELFVGVATMRTVREFLRQQDGQRGGLRAWDVALWSGVTPQGSANSLDRLAGLGMAEVIPSPGYGHARSFRLARKHPLVSPLYRLMKVERGLARRSYGTYESVATTLHRAWTSSDVLD